MTLACLAVLKSIEVVLSSGVSVLPFGLGWVGRIDLAREAARGALAGSGGSSLAVLSSSIFTISERGIMSLVISSLHRAMYRSLVVITIRRVSYRLQEYHVTV